MYKFIGQCMVLLSHPDTGFILMMTGGPKGSEPVSQLPITETRKNMHDTSSLNISMPVRLTECSQQSVSNQIHNYYSLLFDHWSLVNRTWGQFHTLEKGDFMLSSFMY